jgi:hypothetical protein
MGSAMTQSDPTRTKKFKKTLAKILSAPPKPHAKMKVGKKKKTSAKA